MNHLRMTGLCAAAWLGLAAAGCGPRPAASGPGGATATPAAATAPADFPKGMVSRPYARIYDDIHITVAAEPRNAVPLITNIHNADPDNAMNDYLVAAACARTHRWRDAIRWIESGNAAPQCYHYQPDNGPNRSYNALLPLREMVVDAGMAMSDMKRSSAATLAAGLRTMSARIAAMEPQGGVPVLAAINMRAILDRAVGDNERLAADVHWARDAAMQVREVSDQTYADRMAAAMTRAGISADESARWSRGDTLPDEVRRKFEAVAAEMDAVTRPRVRQALAGMPK